MSLLGDRGGRPARRNGTSRVPYIVGEVGKDELSPGHFFGERAKKEGDSGERAGFRAASV